MKTRIQIVTETLKLPEDSSPEEIQKTLKELLADRERLNLLQHESQFDAQQKLLQFDIPQTGLDIRESIDAMAPKGSSLTNGDSLKEKGMAQVSKNNAKWMDDAEAAVRKYVSENGLTHISPNEIRDAVKLYGSGDPHHPNAWGALTNRLRLKKFLVRSNKWTKASRKDSHSRLVPIWEIA